MTEYSVEQVEACIAAYRNGDLNYCRTGIIGLLAAYADLLERIKADEGAVPYGHEFYDASGIYHFIRGDLPGYAQTKIVPLFAYPPAQAAQVDASNLPPCSECGAKSAAEAETMCICSGDKDDCHGTSIWPDDAPTAELAELLKDPVIVHALMLRGAIAIPSIRSMVDLRGEVQNGEDAQLARIAELQEQLAALKDQPAECVVGDGVSRIAAERQRHQSVKGYSPKSDMQYVNHELVDAAIAYAMVAGSDDVDRRKVRTGSPNRGVIGAWWPWPQFAFKPSADDTNASRIRELEKAGALIAAEIDRLTAAQQADR